MKIWKSIQEFNPDANNKKFTPRASTLCAIFTKLCLLTGMLSMVSGCSFSGNNPYIKKTFTWQNAKRALHSASTDYGTVIPLVGAAILGSSSYDDDLAEDAIEDTPIFNESDPKEIGEQTDTLRSLTYVSMLGTALLIPNEDYEKKGYRVLVESGALLATRSVTDVLKNNTNRVSPNGGNTDSLASLHATSPFAGAALTRRNLESADIPDWSKYTINGLTYLAATGSAWGRVEMGIHYPSDQLFGAAVGNFIALFVHDFFLGQPSDMYISFNGHEPYLEFRMTF